MGIASRLHEQHHDGTKEVRIREVPGRTPEVRTTRDRTIILGGTSAPSSRAKKGRKRD